VGSYWASGHRDFLATGDRSHLKPFEGEEINGLPLMTDPTLIEDFDEDFGQVDVRELNRRGSSHERPPQRLDR
jgi:hypothetical protein